MRPVPEFTHLAGDPVNPAPAPAAAQDEGDELVLGCVLRAQEVGGHLPRGRDDGWIGVVILSLGYELNEQGYEGPGEFQKCRPLAILLSVAPVESVLIEGDANADQARYEAAQDQEQGLLSAAHAWQRTLGLLPRGVAFPPPESWQDGARPPRDGLASAVGSRWSP